MAKLLKILNYFTFLSKYSIIIKILILMEALTYCLSIVPLNSVDALYKLTYLYWEVNYNGHVISFVLYTSR